jgi:hypothetical protein
MGHVFVPLDAGLQKKLLVPALSGPSIARQASAHFGDLGSLKLQEPLLQGLAKENLSPVLPGIIGVGQIECQGMTVRQKPLRILDRDKYPFFSPVGMESPSSGTPGQERRTNHSCDQEAPKRSSHPRRHTPESLQASPISLDAGKKRRRGII